MYTDCFCVCLYVEFLLEEELVFEFDIKQRMNLKVVNTRTVSSGVVQLIYHLDENNNAYFRDKT